MIRKLITGLAAFVTVFFFSLQSAYAIRGLYVPASQDAGPLDSTTKWILISLGILLIVMVLVSMVVSIIKSIKNR